MANRRCDHRSRAVYTTRKAMGLHWYRRRPLHKRKRFLSRLVLPSRVKSHISSLLLSVTSAFHILMDIWILVLPLKLIIRIPRPPRDKIALFIIFGLGVISTIASIVRLQSLRIFTLSNDPFYDSLPINTWSMVEVNIGIVCASIPSLKPLLSHAQRHYSEQLSYKCSDRRYEESEWEDAGKPTILKTGKDLMISLHPSNTQVEHEECELFDRPPPPPPKDAKFGAAQQARNYQQVIRTPDTVYRKV